MTNFTEHDSAEGPTLFDELGAQFSARIDALIDARKLTNKEVSVMVGCAESTIRKWRKGRSLPDASDIYALAAALQVHVRELIDPVGKDEEDGNRTDEMLSRGRQAASTPIRDGVLYLRSPTLFEVMAGVIYALDAQCGGLGSDERSDTGYWALRALDLVTESQEAQRALEKEDYEALVRIVAKLRHPDQTGPKGGGNTA